MSDISAHVMAGKTVQVSSPQNGQKDPEGEYRCTCTFSLTSALDGVGGQLHAPAALTPGKRPGMHCKGGCMDKSAGLDGCRKFRLQRDSSLDRPVRSQSL